MEKIICDFCKKNEADSSYRVEQGLRKVKGRFDMTYLEPTYVKRDICKECYDKLFKGDKNGTR